jgi:hypothetical protein
MKTLISIEIDWYVQFIKLECFPSRNSESPEWNKPEMNLLDDWMARWNIELNIGTIIVVDRCATFTSSKNHVMYTT